MGGGGRILGDWGGSVLEELRGEGGRGTAERWWITLNKTCEWRYRQVLG